MKRFSVPVSVARRLILILLLSSALLVDSAGWHPISVKAATPPPNVQAFINTYLSLAQEQYNMYGVPVSVALAQSGIETGWGSSQSMLNHNNFFAITSAVNSPRALGTYVEPSNGYTYTYYASAEDAWLDFGYFLMNDPNYESARPYVNQPRTFYEMIYCIYTKGTPTCDASTALWIWDNWTSQYDDWNSATVTDIPNPDAYTCSQPGHVDFEGLPEGTNLSSGTISGVQFTTTGGFTWLVGDFATGNYNGKYPNGAYTSQGTHWAWLGVTQGAGRIDFPKGPASYFSLLVSNNYPVYLEAYDSSGGLLATAGPALANTNTGHMTELKITRASADMAYVIVHDLGNYFEIDEVCTNAPETPDTIKRIADQTYFMQTGQSVFGSFIVDFISGFRQLLHIFVGPFFSDVDLVLTRPDGSVVLPGDPGVEYIKTANSVEVWIQAAAPGEWQYEIVANELDAGGENIRIVVDEQGFPITNVPPLANAGGPYTANEGQPITLDASGSSDPENNIVLYEWDLDNDGEYDDATGVTAEVTFGDNGPYEVKLRVTDEYGETDTDTAAITIYNVDPSVEATPSSQIVQYSDVPAEELTFIARDVADDEIGTKFEWSVDGGGFEDGLPQNLEKTYDQCSIYGEIRQCVVTLAGTMGVPAGEYTLRFTASDEDGGAAAASLIITVLPEDTTVVLDNENPVSVRVAEDGGNSGPFSLAVTVSEKKPDVPQGSSAPGDISLAQVSMSLVPVGPGGPVDGTCSAGAVTGSGYDAALPVTCEFDDVPVNTYSLQVTVGGGYYAGYAEDVLVVYDPSLGFATGGGWFYWLDTSEKTNFGFTMKYNKKATKVQGNLLLIRHVGDESIYRLKSNALYGLALGGDLAVPMGWASFHGKCTYIDPSGYEHGNYEFVVYVEDRDEPGQGVDRVWIEVLDNHGNVVTVMSMDRDASNPENSVVLGGGNVAVPH